MEELFENEQWFVYNYYATAGRPKMEDAVFEYARTILLYKVINRTDFDAIVTMLNKKQQELYAENKRWKAIDIRWSHYGLEGHDALYIGSQTLQLRRIEGTFNFGRI